MAGSFRRSLFLLSALCLLSVVFTVGLVYNILYTDRPRTGRKQSVMRKISGSSKWQGSEFISALNQRWMTWPSFESPGKYRSCVPYPQPDGVFDRELSGGMVADHTNMTIPLCLDHCISLEFTYAALTRGTRCYCSNVYQSSTLLSYVDSSLCDIPCAGDKKYDCGGKEYFSLYRTSVPDPRCCNISLGKEGTYPFVALASYPRSGNTWTRQLIEQASGIYTGSIYWKKESQQEIGKQVFKGGNIDYRTKRTICIKSHNYQIEHIKQFDAAVLLIRNPYRTLVAEVFRRVMFAREGSVNESMGYFKTDEWQKFVHQQGQSWHETNLNWIKNTKRLLVIHYEQLESDTVKELSRIVQFLDQSKVDQDRISCAVQDNPSSSSTGVALGNFGVKTRAYLTADPFTPSMHTVLDAFILSVNNSLKARNQDALPSDYSNIKVY